MKADWSARAAALRSYLGLGDAAACETVAMTARAANRFPAGRGRLRWAGVLAAAAIACAGCVSSSAGPTGILTVSVIQAGGPATASGGTPHFPLPQAMVEVASDGTSQSATTNTAGKATFHLSGGSYFVSSPTCGSTGKVKVTVAPGRPTTLTWICPVS
jgi:hypothetical protein